MLQMRIFWQIFNQDTCIHTQPFYAIHFAKFRPNLSHTVLVHTLSFFPFDVTFYDVVYQVNGPCISAILFHPVRWVTRFSLSHTFRLNNVQNSRFLDGLR